MPEFVNKNTGIDTDWQDAMLRGGVSQNYMFSIRGGSENAQYSLSYNPVSYTHLLKIEKGSYAYPFFVFNSHFLIFNSQSLI